MHLGASLFSGDPIGSGGRSLGRRDAPVERSRNLHGDEWQGSSDEFGKAIVEPARCIFSHAAADLDPGRAKPGNALAAYDRIGVSRRYYHTPNPRGQQCIRAGPCSSMMGARFQSYVCGSAPRQRAGLFKSNDFCVVALIILMEAFPHQSIVADQHAADRGIRRGQADGLLSLFERAFHPLLVDIRHHG
jgi:hypothetical protein